MPSTTLARPIHPSSLHITHQRLPTRLAQPTLHKQCNLAILSPIRRHQVLSYPLLHIHNLRPVVSCQSLDGDELRKAHAKGHVIDIMFGNEIIRRWWKRRVDEQLQQPVAGKSPALFVALRKRLRVGERLGERDDGYFSVQRARELVGAFENHFEVEGHKGFGVDLVDDGDEEIGAHALVLFGGDEMVEADEAGFEALAGLLVDFCEHNLEDGHVVLLQSRSGCVQYLPILDGFWRGELTVGNGSRCTRGFRMPVLRLPLN
jgi:hypothetical protein